MSGIVRYRVKGSAKTKTVVVNEGPSISPSLYISYLSRPLYTLTKSDIGASEIISIRQNEDFTYPFFDGVGVASEADEDENWGIEYLRGNEFYQHGLRGSGIRVGIADTGLDVSHPCFRDLDLKKFVDIDRVTGVRHEVPPIDSKWHGTFCTAILAGKKNNSFERGLADQVQLYVAKVFNKFNSSLTAVHSAFEFFIENKVHIVSFSMGSPNKESIWADIVRDYLDTGGIVVAGIGNDYLGTGPTISPANYPLTGVIAVGAHDHESNIWERSGGGVLNWAGDEAFGGYASVTKPDVSAPGVGICSVAEEQRFRISNGTSFATPHVAGLLACIWSADTSQSRDEVIQKYEQMLTDKGVTGHDERFGRGVIDTSPFLQNILHGNPD